MPCTIIWFPVFFFSTALTYQDSVSCHATLFLSFQYVFPPISHLLCHSVTLLQSLPFPAPSLPSFHRRAPIIHLHVRRSPTQTPFPVQPFSLSRHYYNIPPLSVYSLISHTAPYPPRFPFFLIPFPFVSPPFSHFHNLSVPSLLTIPFAFMYPPAIS